MDTALPRSSTFSERLRAFGNGMQRHRRAILVLQWAVVLLYLGLVTVPAFLPLPPQSAHLYNNLTLFAQFLFWGIWWPFVMLSMMLLGRVWCGVFCPEGALTEFASRHGLGRAIPRWLRWGGWPFLAFVITTVYGQLVSVYEYPQATLLILGGSTLAAMVVGFIYGRGKRVWCRYLCPANGVFRLLARVAPLHFVTDTNAWRTAAARTPAVDCAPLVDVRHLSSMAECHACGRCSGHRNAVQLAPRSPNQELLRLRDRDVSRWEALTLVYGVLGVALGAFQWSASPWYVALKQVIASWLIDQHALGLLADNAPWYLLTHYPEANDVFTWLDGALVVFYISATAFIVGSWVLLWLYAAATLVRQPRLKWRLAYCLTPLAGASVFIGLSMLTVTLLRAEGLALSWVPTLRVALLSSALLWSASLAWRLLQANAISIVRRWAALAAAIAAMSAIIGAWTLMLFVW